MFAEWVEVLKETTLEVNLNSPTVLFSFYSSNSRLNRSSFEGKQASANDSSSIIVNVVAHDILQMSFRTCTVVLFPLPFQFIKFDLIYKVFHFAFESI